MREEWEKNRDVKRKPKQGKFWCGVCDHYLIHEGEKCRYCNIRDKRKRNKK